MRDSKEDNRGFSLVELVIVIAIMAVMGAFYFLGNALLTGQYARECANDISTALNKEKNYALTRSATIDCYMELVKDTDGYYVRYYQPKNAIVKGDTPSDDWVLADEEKVGKSSVEVVCTFRDNGGSVLSSAQIGTAQSVKFVYDRISGAFKPVVISDGATSGIESGGTVFSTADIEISGGRIYDIEIYYDTGKHVLTRVD